MAITDLEIRMTIKTLAAKGVPKRAIARQLTSTKAPSATTWPDWRPAPATAARSSLAALAP